MDTESVQLTAIARGEINALAQGTGDLNVRELRQRLEQLIVLANKIKDDSAEKSSATELFNIYELVEMIFEQLSFADLIKAQQICRITRDMAITSFRLRGVSVYGGDLYNLRASTPPFNSIIDFDLALSDPDIIGPSYLISNHPDYCLNAAGTKPESMHLTFTLTSNPHRTWRNRSAREWDRSHDKSVIYERTVIAPAPRYTLPGEFEKPLDHDALEMWRHVRWAPVSSGKISVTFESQCKRDHTCEDTRVFPAGVTLGQSSSVRNSQLLGIVDLMPLTQV